MSWEDEHIVHTLTTNGEAVLKRITNVYLARVFHLNELRRF